MAQRVIDGDTAIDQMELEIDQHTIELIAMMQPAAVDLRFVAAAMKITPELERDRRPGRRRLRARHRAQSRAAAQAAASTSRASRASRRTWCGQALDAFVRRDAVLAREVIARDDEADLLTEQSFRELLTYMLEDSRNISRAIRLTFIGKYFERMADGATNICEMVVYLAEGKVIKHSGDRVQP